MKTVNCLGQPSWRFASNKIEAAITRLGGQLAPVRFRLGRKIIEPFSVAPWAEERLAPGTQRVLQALRGDFFCAPFGGNAKIYRGEKHPPHGEAASALWQFKSLKKDKATTELKLSLATKVRRGRIDKLIQLRKGETAIYCRHTLSGMTGAMSIGQHAMLKFPDEMGSGHISTSAIKYGQVVPADFEEPAKAGYTSLKPEAVFSRLDRVPSKEGGNADLSRYPARPGFEDLVMVVHEARPDFAWTAAAFPEEGYVWFSLKDPRVLRSTVIWISNRGRHYAPWSGRHGNVMGLEDVTAYFHYGLAESAQANQVNRRGFATSVQLNPKTPLTVSYIMAIAAIPRSFKRVKTIQTVDGGVQLLSDGGRSITVPLDISFLYETKRN